MFETTKRHTRNASRSAGPFGSVAAVAVLVGSIAVAALIVLAVFRLYSDSLSAEFYQMTSESMNDFTVAQKVEVESSIRETNAALSAMRMLAESPDIDPGGSTFTSYIDSWNEQGSFRITYVTVADLEASLNDRGSVSQDVETLEKLKAGETVVSDVRKSNRLNGYFYSIAEPVKRDGQVVGVLRSIMEADKLLRTSQVSSQVSLIGSALIEADGTIIGVDEESARLDGTSLYQKLKDSGFSDQAVDEVRANVDNELDVATVTLGKRDGRMMFFTSIRLGVNDWTIVNFTEESGLAAHSQAILGDTIVTGTLLVAISAVACIVVAIVIGRFRKRAMRDAERYAALAEFSDTVLFEYSYRSDTLEVTPNAREVFSLGTLRYERYLAKGIPLIDFLEEDYALVRDLLEHPAPPDETRTIAVRAHVLSGECRWFSITCRYLYEGAQPYLAVGKVVDITQQREKEELLEWKSQMDGLTKAYNKVTIEEKIATLLHTAGRGLLFVIDLDRFKQVNDEFGHSMGDRVLEAVARSLFDVFRRRDPVGRIGGDEFVAFVSGVDGDDVARAKRAALLESVEAASRTLGVPIAVSVGVARYPLDGTTYQELFDAADRNMYEEKHGKQA